MFVDEFMWAVNCEDGLWRFGWKNKVCSAKIINILYRNNDNYIVMLYSILNNAI